MINLNLVILRDASISAMDFANVEKASKMTITADMVPGLEEEFDIVLLNDEAVVTYDNVDLTNVNQMMMTYLAPTGFAAGGKFSLHLDDANNAAIYEGDMTATEMMGAPNTVVLPMANLSRQHTLTAKYKFNKEGSLVGTLLN